MTVPAPNPSAPAPSAPAPSDPAPSDYPHRRAIPTRWKDNDVYGHVNNVEYYSFFDTVINAWLIEEGELDIHRGEVIGICAESHCEYRAALAFPETVQAGLRVGHLGRSSVRYEIGLFREAPRGERVDDSGGALPEREGIPAGEGGELLATGWFVHVFVAREGRRPVEIPAHLRAALERLVVAGDRARTGGGA